jgi:uncharacterized linocin/CFP29 family protein
MDLLKRELAPIVAEAWAEIDRQAQRVLRLNLAARKLVDVDGPHGWHYAAINLGRVVDLPSAPAEGVRGALRSVRQLVELRAPFRLSIAELDAAARGANDIDLDPVIEAAERIAEAEDHAVFNGYPEAGIEGIVQASPHAAMTMPDAALAYPQAILEALDMMREAGIDGPYALALGTYCFKQLSLATEAGYPIRKRMEQQILERPVLWAPSVSGAVLLSVRGGDFVLTVGADLSIGYAAHDQREVELYLVESLSFHVLEGAAAVHLRSPAEAEAQTKQKTRSVRADRRRSER